MKRFSLFISVLAISALTLAACSASTGNRSKNPGPTPPAQNGQQVPTAVGSGSNSSGQNLNGRGSVVPTAIGQKQSVPPPGTIVPGGQTTPVGTITYQKTPTPLATIPVPTGTTAAALPSTGAGPTSIPTPASTSQGALSGTPTPAGMSSGTPTSAPTSSPTSMASGTPSASGTPGLPATGIFNSNRLLVFDTLPVVNQSGQKIGQVQNAVFSLCTGQIEYLIISPTGSAGTSASSGSVIVVPWQVVSVKSQASASATGTPMAATGTPAATMSATGTPSASASASGSSAGVVILNVSSSKLNNAPTFLSSALPNVNIPGWDKQVRSYWGMGQAMNQNCQTNPSASMTVTPMVSGTSSAMGTATVTPAPTVALPSTGGSSTVGPQVTILAKDLIGSSVVSSGGKNLGTISDAVLDLNKGTVQYLVVSAASSLNIGQKYIVVPLNAFELSSNGQQSMSATGTPAATMSATGTPSATSTATGKNQITLMVKVSESTFMQAPNFSYGGLPNTSVPGWDTQIKSFWSQNLK